MRAQIKNLRKKRKPTKTNPQTNKKPKQRDPRQVYREYIIRFKIPHHMPDSNVVTHTLELTRNKTPNSVLHSWCNVIFFYCQEICVSAKRTG